MNEIDFSRFVKSFSILCEVFEKETSPILQAAYFRSLECFKIKEVEVAISDAVRECKFFPRPVELLEQITGGAQALEDVATVQAHSVLNAVRRVGGYRSVVFADPVTAAVVLQGYDGWANLCRDLKDLNAKWFVKEFVNLYQTYARRGIKQVAHLPGRIEIENSNLGFDYEDPPVLIGDGENRRLLPS